MNGAATLLVAGIIVALLIWAWVGINKALDRSKERRDAEKWKRSRSSSSVNGTSLRSGRGTSR